MLDEHVDGGRLASVVRWLRRASVWLPGMAVVGFALFMARGRYVASFAPDAIVFAGSWWSMMFVGGLGFQRGQPMIIRLTGSLSLAAMVIANYVIAISGDHSPSLVGPLITLGAFALVFPLTLILGHPHIKNWISRKGGAPVDPTQTTRKLALSDLFAVMTLVAFCVLIAGLVYGTNYNLAGGSLHIGEGFIALAISLLIPLLPSCVLLLWKQHRARRHRLAVTLGPLLAIGSLYFLLASPFSRYVNVLILSTLSCVLFAGIHFGTIYFPISEEPLVVDDASTGPWWKGLLRQPWAAVVIIAAWFVVATVSGTFQRHAMHRSVPASFTYANHRQLSTIEFEEHDSGLFGVLDSPFAINVDTIYSHYFEEGRNLNDEVVDRMLQLKHLNEVAYSASVTESQFIRLLDSRDWSVLSLSVRDSSCPSIVAAMCRNPDSQVGISGIARTMRISGQMYFCITARSREDVDAITLSNLHSLRITTSTLTDDDIKATASRLQPTQLELQPSEATPKYTLKGMLELVRQVPSTNVELILRTDAGNYSTAIISQSEIELSGYEFKADENLDLRDFKIVTLSYCTFPPNVAIPRLRPDVELVTDDESLTDDLIDRLNRCEQASLRLASSGMDSVLESKTKWEASLAKRLGKIKSVQRLTISSFWFPDECNLVVPTSSSIRVLRVHDTIDASTLRRWTGATPHLKIELFDYTAEESFE